jgi:hypothetical protein
VKQQEAAVVQSIRDWNLPDPYPSLALEDIERVSTRALALIARSKDAPILSVGFVNVAGAIEMMQGMDYHHTKFLSILRALAVGAETDPIDLNHEAVAYINRMGQFRAFADSQFVKSTLPDALERIPTIGKLLVFRNKHTAHRSIDAPWRADTDELQWVHARSLSTLGGRLFTPRPDALMPPPDDISTVEEAKMRSRANYRSAYLTFQIFDTARGEHVDFAIERDHPRIIEEAYALVELLITTT